MSQVRVRLAVEDFARWLAVFEESAPMRRDHSSRGVRVLRPVDKPNEVVIVAEYADLEQARRMFQSQEYRHAVRRAGVVGMPEVTFLDEATHLAA